MAALWALMLKDAVDSPMTGDEKVTLKSISGETEPRDATTMVGTGGAYSTTLAVAFHVALEPMFGGYTLGTAEGNHNETLTGCCEATPGASITVNVYFKPSGTPRTSVREDSSTSVSTTNDEGSNPSTTRVKLTWNCSTLLDHGL